MGHPRCIPEHPAFLSTAEEAVWTALRARLRDDDVLLHGVRLSDGLCGDVEIDLLVLMPDCGAAVIEVKGGHVTYSGGAWASSGAQGVVPVHPVEQARNGMHALRRFVQRQPAWSRGPLRAMWFVAFPYTVVAGDMGPEGSRELILDEKDLPEAAGRIFDGLHGSRHRTATPAAGWVDALVELLHGAPDPVREAAGRTAARLRHAEQLTSEQAALLSVVRDNRLLEITGTAGTGKTWMAMEQAQRWAAAGLRVAFVSYGRGVARMVRSALADAPRRARPAFIGTFHELGFSWGVAAPPSPDDEFWVSAAAEQMRAAGAGLAPADRFDAFIVDEAQDFADSWWGALLSSARDPAAFHLAVFRDDEQSVFADRLGRPRLPMVHLTLDHNLRNARQIVDTFRPLLRTPVTSMGGDGFPVEFVDATAIDADIYGAASDVAMTLIDERGWLPEQVALLTTRHRHPVHVELAADRARYWDLLWSADDVFYATVNGFKGLERPAVVLAVDGFHDGTDPRTVMYAGMSRASDLLIVVADPGPLAAVVGEKTMRRLGRSGSRQP